MAHVMGEMEIELIFTDTLVVISPFLALSISAIKKIGDDILPDDHLFHADDEPDDHLLNSDDNADDRLLHADHLLFSILVIDRPKISLSCHILHPPQRTAQSGFWTDVDRSTLQIYQNYQIDVSKSWKSYYFFPFLKIISDRKQKAVYISKYYTFFLFV